MTGDGRSITIKVDGKTAAHFNDENDTHREGHFALQHTAGTTIAFRKIEVPTPAPGYAKSRPKPWSVILCKFSDLPANEPHPVDFYREAFTEAGRIKGREFDYFRQVSHEGIDMTGSKVFGWYAMPEHTSKETQTLNDRRVILPRVVEVARANVVDLSPFFGVQVIFNAAADSGDWGLGPHLVIGYEKNECSTDFNCHELGHGFGLDHARCARPLTE